MNVESTVEKERIETAFQISKVVDAFKKTEEKFQKGFDLIKSSCDRSFGKGNERLNKWDDGLQRSFRKIREKGNDLKSKAVDKDANQYRVCELSTKLLHDTATHDRLINLTEEYQDDMESLQGVLKRIREAKRQLQSEIEIEEEWKRRVDNLSMTVEDLHATSFKLQSTNEYASQYTKYLSEQLVQVRKNWRVDTAGSRGLQWVDQDGIITIDSHESPSDNEEIMKKLRKR